MSKAPATRQLVCGLIFSLAALALPNCLSAEALDVKFVAVPPPDLSQLGSHPVSNNRCHIMPLQGVSPVDAQRPDCDPMKRGPRGGQPPAGVLTYGGGPLITSAQQQFIFVNCPVSCATDWGDPITFLADMFASPFVHVSDQYTNVRTNGRYTVNNTAFTLNTGIPHTITDAQLQGLVLQVIKSAFPNGGGGGYNRMWSIFLPPGQDLCFTSGAGAECYCPDQNCNGGTFAFCAYHDAFDTTDAIGNPIHVVYQAQPFDDVSGCRVSNGPNGHLKDSVNNVFSHEVFESITDPDPPSGWNSPQGEIGDLCNFNEQNPIALNGRLYAIQKEYSNAAANCAGLVDAWNTHDFNGGGGNNASTGRSDIAWRDNTGNTAVWLMNGLQVTSTQTLGPVSGWSIIGQRDFNFDSNYDLLWRDNSGNVAIWFLSGTSVIGSAGLGNVPPSWTVVATGDFNGDGIGDVLWQDSSGHIAVWLMNGSQIMQALAVGTVAAPWHIVGAADFNADGNTDILWRNTSTGDVAVWLMNGAQIFQNLSVGNVATVWSITGTGDFNGDGKGDILWQDTSGNVAVWLMNGAVVAQSGGLGNVPPGVWTIQDTGDFNGDAKSDIMWRDTGGNIAIWFMNGVAVQSSGVVGNVATSWVIQGLNVD